MSGKLPQHLHRNRHGQLYFRRAVPLQLREMLGVSEVYRSLGTGPRSELLVRLRRYSAITDDLFARLSEAMVRKKKKKKSETFRLDMVSHLEFPNGLKMRFESEPHEVEQAKAVIEHAIKLGATAGLQSGPIIRGPSKPIGDAISKYMNELASSGQHSAQSLMDYRGDFDQLLQVLDVERLSDLTHEVLNRAKQTLLSLPPNLNKNPATRGKPLAEVLSLKLEPQSPLTVRKKWGRFDAFLDWCVVHGYVEANYAKGKAPKATAQSYEKFSDDDLNRLFRTPMFIDATYDEPFKYWLPALAAFTGARINELAQLLVEDVFFDDQHGFWVLRITDETETKALRKTLKNRSSRRSCPAHPALLAAGLPAFVQELRAHGHQRLFPELGLNQYGKVGERASEWFTQYRRECGVGDATGRSGKVFHSFRHTLNSRLQASEVPQEVREAICGHASQAVNVRTYGGDLLPLMARHLGRLTYPFELVPFVSRPAHEEARRRAAS